MFLEIIGMKRIIIADCRADDRTIKALQKTGHTVIPTMLMDCVYDAIASHADIQIHYLGNNRFVCAPEAYEYYKKYLPDGFTLIKGSKPLGSKYPDDIPYNAAAVGKTLICNSHSTAIEILSEYSCSTRNILNVNQGYTKCSTCIVNGNAIITADTSIANAAKKNSIDVLKINEGYVELKGMNYGFIGGASGLIEENVLAFNGELNTHPDEEEIKKFCKNHGVDIIELKNDILTDLGSIITNIEI